MKRCCNNERLGREGLPLQASSPHKEDHILRGPEQKGGQANQQHHLAVNQQFRHSQGPNEQKEQEHVADPQPQSYGAEREALTEEK